MNIAARLRARRSRTRDRRAVERAISHAATPAMRNELIVMAQQQLYTNR
jgi:hypothetical protein